ncbi:hypothetical protein [Staphylococcus delphini]|uniref:hypothetical protein n=1 Tax=Staphylococcus delphini TaxID=53344 RepID=UPI0023B28F04|nr:hypothetical protein [Staphylococcus delphini]MDE9753467.1 hypothetical protein [Staphylococcus delphini]MDE9790588.1 hypothetical protein [Staphylococcus delphini]MDE9791796.1 hypothetical protein [Staphylococcus delphini]MDE9795463.1 hypothetical protein [Staphylococcus delphini]MDE9797631.1 hypothetical protein [Staphylococcus delphini]
MKDNQLVLSISSDTIEFRLQDDRLVGITNYRKDIWEEFNSVNWYINIENLEKQDKSYVYTGSKKFANKKFLHAIVMIKWYGEKAVSYAHQNGFIIEHFDNNEHNCMIDNLAFVSNDLNLAKAHLYDKERVKYKDVVAVNFFKDIDTQRYQATFGFNEEVILQEKGRFLNVTALKLVYPDDYRQVFQDLTNAMHQIISNRTINLDLLSHEYRELSPTKYIICPSKEEIPVVIQEGGKYYIVLSDRVRLDKIPPNNKLYKREAKD